MLMNAWKEFNTQIVPNAKDRLESIGCTVYRNENTLKGFILVRSESDLEKIASEIMGVLSLLGEGSLWDEEEGESLWRIDFHGSLQD